VNSSTFNGQAPFFVVGSDRSGTTMLMMMLDAHQNLGVSRESWFLIDLMNALPLRSPLDQSQVDKAFQIISQHPRWLRWSIPDAQLEQCLEKMAGHNLSKLVEAVFKLDLERSNKSRWGDKTPGYVREIGRIHSMFPQACFIHIIRDARDVCISLKNVGWHGTTLGDMAQYWSNAVSSGIRAGRLLGDDLYLEVAYEELVRNTESSLKKICRFLKIPFDENMLLWHELTASKTADRPMRFQTKLNRPPRASDTERWRTELSKLEVAIVEANAGDVMDAVGQQRYYTKNQQLVKLLVSLSLILRSVAVRMLRIFRR
jgi:hypothetical protein